MQNYSENFFMKYQLAKLENLSELFHYHDLEYLSYSQIKIDNLG
jgi:hypothetical protein